MSISAIKFDNISLDAPNHNPLDLYFSANGIYLSVAQLYQIGVDTKPFQQYTTTLRDGGFANFVDFHSIDDDCIPDDLRAWWEHISSSYLCEKHDRFCTMQNFFKRKLAVDLLDLPNSIRFEIDTDGIKRLKDLPFCYLKQIEAFLNEFQNAALDALATANNKEIGARLQFRVDKDKTNFAPIIEVDGYAVIVSDFDVYGKKFNVYSVSADDEFINGRIFIDMLQLADIIDPVLDVAVSVQTAEKNLYIIKAPRSVQGKRLVDVADVPAILETYIRYFLTDLNVYEVVKELLTVGNVTKFYRHVGINDSEDLPVTKEPTEKQLVDKFSAYFDIPRDKVIQFILDQREADFKRRQADLRKILA